MALNTCWQLPNRVIKNMFYISSYVYTKKDNLMAIKFHTPLGRIKVIFCPLKWYPHGSRHSIVNWTKILRRLGHSCLRRWLLLVNAAKSNQIYRKVPLEKLEQFEQARNYEEPKFQVRFNLILIFLNPSLTSLSRSKIYFVKIL